MKSIKNLLFIVIVLFISLEANENLAQDDYWLKLLHSQTVVSTVDAKKELKRTLTLFQTDPTSLCQYPARYKWLNSKLDLNLSKPSCSSLEKFRDLHFKKLSVVFTSERYDSPASVFGHTMMKVETDSIPYAINYSAKIPDNINSLEYIFKGINGRFISGYSFMPFSTKEYEYRSGEFRDLITFELHLTPDEIENIMLYFYEIQNSKENYYFLSHNCSSELIKLIDMAKYNSKLSKEFSSVTIPINIIYLLQKYNYIKEITTKHSKLKQFYTIINQLNSKEREILFKITHFQYSVNKFAKNKMLSKNSKYLITVAGIQYFEIKSTKESLTQKSLYPFMKLIALKLKYNQTKDFSQLKVLNKNPISNKFHKFYVGTLSNSNNSHKMILGYRYLYRDRFDLMDSFKKNGTVELLDFAITKKSEKISLEHLTLLNLEAMPVSNIFFQETINKIKIETARVFEDDKLYTYFNYGLGYRYRLNRLIDYQFYLKTGIYYNTKPIYLASAEISFEYNYNNRFISELMLELNSFSNEVIQKNISLHNYMKLSSSIVTELKLVDKNHRKKSSEIMFLINYFF